MRLLFAGTPEFAARHLRALLDAGFALAAVLTQPDRPGKRGRQPQPSPVKRLALAAGLQVRQPAKLRLADIADLKADLMVVVAYGQILAPPVLAHPRLGCVNVHASLLPRWRGAAPMQRALLAGDSATGITLVQMDAGLDTGPMLAQQQVAIAERETCGSLEEKLAQAGTAALVETLRRLPDIKPRPQPEAGASYARKIGKAEARLDWRQPASALDRQVRAFSPAPGAHAFLGDMQFKVRQAEPLGPEPGGAPAPPGTVLAADRRAIAIACGEGRLALTQVQLPKGKGVPLSAADVFNAYRALFKPGEALG